MKRRLKYLLILLFFVCAFALTAPYFLQGLIYASPSARTGFIMDRIRSDIKRYLIAHNKLPDNLKELNKSLYKDVWGRRIIYKIEDGEVWLISFGADGIPKNDDDIICHWVPTKKYEKVKRLHAPPYEHDIDKVEWINGWNDGGNKREDGASLGK